MGGIIERTRRFLSDSRRWLPARGGPAMRRHLPETNFQTNSTAKLAVTAQGDPVSNTLGRWRKSISKCEKATAVHQDKELLR